MAQSRKEGKKRSEEERGIAKIGEEYLSMKIPKNVRIEAEMAKAKLMTGGKDAFAKISPEVLNPTKCPICSSKMKEIDVRTRIGYKKCEKCGFSQPYLDISAEGINDIPSLLIAVGLGTLFGLGIAALLKLMSE